MIAFLRELFQDDGRADIGKVCLAVCTTAVIAWVTYLVHKNGSMPDLSGPSVFLGASGTVHYASSKVDNIVSIFKNGGDKK